jgi:predicted lipid-binding transport protein (Tim44 family)
VDCKLFDGLVGFGVDDAVLDSGKLLNTICAVKKEREEVRQQFAEATDEIERLRTRLQAANAEAIAASEQAARDADAANDMMQERNACRRLLREAVEGYDAADTDERAFLLGHNWYEAARKAGGHNE